LAPTWSVEVHGKKKILTESRWRSRSRPIQYKGLFSVRCGLNARSRPYLFRRLCVRCFRQSTDSRHAERHLPFCQLPTRNVKTGRGPSSPAVICILCDGSGRKDHSIPTPRGYCMGSSVRYCKLQLLIPSPSISLKGGRISKASAAGIRCYRYSI
jgi:hypothetical protein